MKVLQACCFLSAYVIMSKEVCSVAPFPQLHCCSPTQFYPSVPPFSILTHIFHLLPSPLSFSISLSVSRPQLNLQTNPLTTLNYHLYDQDT